MAIRIISAFVGIVFGVGVLLFDNIYAYCAVLSFFAAVGTYEIIKAVKCNKNKPILISSIAFAALMPFFLNITFLKPYSLVLCFVYVLGLFVTQLAMHKSVRTADIAICGAGSFILPFSLCCILFVRYSMENSLLGVSLIFYTLFCAWFGDSGAYFVGTFLGKHKLCPEISPKKTVEGLVGGIVTVGIVSLIHCLVFNFFIADGAQMSYAVLIPVGMAASGMGVIGDLSASIIKRQYDVKDFGNIMPGHGGVLDRFDSVIFVAPFLCMVFNFLSPAM